MSEFYKNDSIEKLVREANKLVENLNGNPFSQFEKIAKDIVERQDNAKAMEFTKNIGNALIENGVYPKMVEYKTGGVVKDGNTIEEYYNVGFDGLDFSEHDKVFEDKIAKLENLLQKQDEFFDMKNIQIDELNQRIAELENLINNKLGGWDKRGISYQEILDMKDKNENLKKRIAELESELENKKSEAEIPFEPIEAANYLINCKVHADAVLFLPERDVSAFDLSELEQIAEHLLVYCKHNKEVE